MSVEKCWYIKSAQNENRQANNSTARQWAKKNRAPRKIKISK